MAMRKNTSYTEIDEDLARSLEFSTLDVTLDLKAVGAHLVESTDEQVVLRVHSRPLPFKELHAFLMQNNTDSPEHRVTALAERLAEHWQKWELEELVLTMLSREGR